MDNKSISAKNLVEKPYRVIASGTMLSVIQVHPRDIIDRPGTKYEPYKTANCLLKGTLRIYPSAISIFHLQ